MFTTPYTPIQGMHVSGEEEEWLLPPRKQGRDVSELYMESLLDRLNQIMDKEFMSEMSMTNRVLKKGEGNRSSDD
jgi:hypothetical protein